MMSLSYCMNTFCKTNLEGLKPRAELMGYSNTLASPLREILDVLSWSPREETLPPRFSLPQGVSAEALRPPPAANKGPPARTGVTGKAGTMWKARRLSAVVLKRQPQTTWRAGLHALSLIHEVWNGA